MKKTEVVQLLSLIEAEYPQSFRGLSEEQRNLKIGLWEKEFENDESIVVYSAVRTLMRSGREFAPTSGQIREKMTEFLELDKLDEQQAWALVAKACSNGLYGYKTEFKKLPPEVQAAVGTAEQLKEWAAVDADTLQTVVASNFMRSYRTSLARAKELARIPVEVRTMISGISEKMRLTGNVG